MTAVHIFRRTAEAYDAAQTRADINDGDLLVATDERVVGVLCAAWPVAITEAAGHFHRSTIPAREMEGGRYTDAVAAAEQLAGELGYPLPTTAAEQTDARPAIEGRIVTHQGQTAGCMPAHADHPDVRAALDVLGTLPLALLHGDDPQECTDAHGIMVDPRGNGRVALYWLVGGQDVDDQREPWRAELRIIADTMRAAGWAVEPGSFRCVFAHRPAAAERDTAGTWRAGWISSDGTPGLQLTIPGTRPDVDQGALF